MNTLKPPELEAVHRYIREHRTLVLVPGTYPTVEDMILALSMDKRVKFTLRGPLHEKDHFDCEVPLPHWGMFRVTLVNIDYVKGFGLFVANASEVTIDDPSLYNALIRTILSILY